ncbi:MAG: AbrB/MazE/SpoVT family DNA-binding domain-containing protein [Desulfitobacteriaceae bacterium]|nr:AbrB/MazE/SpoVT family DNA-binding domain-containing protein [Desulfitobacteriaceae bacterium]
MIDFYAAHKMLMWFAAISLPIAGCLLYYKTFGPHTVSGKEIGPGNNAIVIRPVRESGGEFDEQILADLIAQGLLGQELLDKFKETRRQIRPAVERLLDEVRLAAQSKTSNNSYDDIFGS